MKRTFELASWLPIIGIFIFAITSAYEEEYPSRKRDALIIYIFLYHLITYILLAWVIGIHWIFKLLSITI